jgi:HK97 family phage portal protein
VINGFRAIAKRAFGIADLDRLMDLAITGPPTDSGYPVTEISSMRLPAVWSCVNLIGKAGSVLPGNVFRKIEGGLKPHEIAVNHYLQPIIHDRVNPWLSSMEWVLLATVQYLLWGNHYSWVEWAGNDRVRGLYPIDPARVRVERGSALNSGVRYWIRGADGQETEFPEWSIFHWKGTSIDGVTGLSPIGMMREAVGLVGANQKSAASFHKNGFTNRLVLEYPQALDPTQMDALKKSFNEAYSGLQNAHKAIILQNGMTAKPISINPNDAQFLEQAKFSNAEVYKIFGVPPHMVGDTEKATSWGTGIEQQTIGFVTYTLMPIIKSLETALEQQLLPDSNTDVFIEYEFKGLMRGDTAARSAWHRTMIESGVYSPNDVLAYENEDPYIGGDVYRRPMNMQFVDKSGNVVLKTEPEKPEPAKEASTNE